MIDAFLSAILDQDLRALATHWSRARGSKLMPAWNDLEPRAIAPQLPVMWSYTYRGEDDAFVGRLAGDRIESIVHASFRGRNMNEIFAGRDFDWLHTTCKRVVTGRTLHSGGGTIFANSHPLGVGERIIMPLSSNGIDADGVLGATVYPKAGITRASFDFYEREDWFPLKPRVAATS